MANHICNQVPGLNGTKSRHLEIVCFIMPLVFELQVDVFRSL
jgi:hypothetical protein